MFGVGLSCVSCFNEIHRHWCTEIVASISHQGIYNMSPASRQFASSLSGLLGFAEAERRALVVAGLAPNSPLRQRRGLQTGLRYALPCPDRDQLPVSRGSTGVGLFFQRAGRRGSARNQPGLHRAVYHGNLSYMSLSQLCCWSCLLELEADSLKSK